MNKINKSIKKIADYLEEFDPFYDPDEFNFPMPEYKKNKEEPIPFPIEEEEDFPFD